MKQHSLLAPPEFYKKACRIVLPICFQQLLNQGAGFLDTLMVSYVGYVSAVAVAGDLSNLLFLFGFGINSGISVYATQFYGIRDWKNLKRSFGLFMMLNFFAALLFFLLAQIGCTTLLSFYSKDTSLVSMAWEYLQVSCYSFFFVSLTNAFSFMYRCIQKTVVPMVIGICVNVINAVGNYLLIFGKLGLPELGARGAALSTVIATGLGLAAHIIYAIVTHQPFLGTWREMANWPFSFIRPMLRRMLPIMANEMLFGFGDTMYIKAFALLGSTALESYKVAYSIHMIPYVVAIGMGNACTILLGECLGRKELQRAKDTVRWLLPISAVASVVLSAFLLLLARPAVNLFSLSSQELAQSTILMVRLFSLRIVSRLFNVVFLFAIRAGGDTGYLMFLDCGLVWLLGIPIAFGSVLLLGVSTLPALFLLVQIEQLVRLLLAIRRYRSGIWLRNLTDEVD
ncbi:MAG: MATE family efflux transporter [Ruminococcaceae bacterium]|nr:MATE family efflux transporter [Oscillospiraceae bacterium]